MALECPRRTRATRMNQAPCAPEIRATPVRAVGSGQHRRRRQRPQLRRRQHERRRDRPPVPALSASGRCQGVLGSATHLSWRPGGWWYPRTHSAMPSPDWLHPVNVMAKATPAITRRAALVVPTDSSSPIGPGRPPLLDRVAERRAAPRMATACRSWTATRSVTVGLTCSIAISYPASPI